MVGAPSLRPSGAEAVSIPSARRAADQPDSTRRGAGAASSIDDGVLEQLALWLAEVAAEIELAAQQRADGVEWCAAVQATGERSGSSN
jgi:hypothetical protein